MSESAVRAEPASFADEMNEVRAAVDARLDQLLPPQGEPSLAARHSLLAPGKRLRAVLCVLAARQCAGPGLGETGAGEAGLLDVACAVEMVHTASLVFDDLPAMDDADLRRGVATPHKLYGDDVAILAGIGLLNGAFGVVAGAQGLGAEQRVEIVEVLSRAIGWTGLVQGQAMDLRGAEGASLEDVHHGKTGALFVAAALAGAACAGAPVSARAPLVAYGRELGLAYQALDDVLDQVASDGAAGKTTGRDAGKRTAVVIGSVPSDGLAAAKARAERHLARAAEAASGPHAGSPLAELTVHVRRHFERLS